MVLRIPNMVDFSGEPVVRQDARVLCAAFAEVAAEVFFRAETMEQKTQKKCNARWLHGCFMFLKRNSPLLGEMIQFD